jgi:murein tripeptide amidase MpaA
VYIGPGAFSEPETQNVKWILDQHPNIRFFVDLHSYGELAMYSWGDAVDQASKKSMNFLNSTYDGKRGLSGSGAYKEYLPSADKSVATDLAKRMQSAIKAVRGTKYGVQQDFALYPTAGCSDDYAASRTYAQPGLSKIYGFTIEWGKEFQPPYTEMQKIMQEISAALLDFCLGALAATHAAHEHKVAVPA